MYGPGGGLPRLRIDHEGASAGGQRGEALVTGVKPKARWIITLLLLQVTESIGVAIRCGYVSNLTTEVI